MSRSPFTGCSDGPSADAVVVPLGRPTRAALGCFGLTTLFLAVVALAALSYGIVGAPGPQGAPAALRPVAAVLGVVFAVIVAGLVTVIVRATAPRQGLAFDADAVWWRADRSLVRLPWQDIAVVRVVAPATTKGVRTSAPRMPTVEVCPVDEATVLRHPALADCVTGGEPVRDGLPRLRFAFRLSSAEDGRLVAAAVPRCAPERWSE